MVSKNSDQKAKMTMVDEEMINREHSILRSNSNITDILETEKT